jgi:hypothetical protein
MITNNGKQIIAKYLLDQAPAFATHIAAGCGSRPLLPGEQSTIPSNKDALDFEVFRVPIISKGFIKEGGQEKIVFKAEMPTEQRYLVSEVGFYPAISNSVAGKYDSKLLITFTPLESWSYVLDGSASAVILSETPLDDDNQESNISTPLTAQFVYSDATIFNNTLRKNRQEPPRFLNRSLLISGSSSFIDENFLILEGSGYLENPGINFDLSRNTTTDKIKLAFSLASKEFNNDSNPDSVRIVIQFINNISNINIQSPKAVLNIELNEEDFEYENGPENNVNRYVVVEKQISELIKDDNFSFANINYIRIYVSAIKDNLATDDYYICLDGLRLDNTSSRNPLYSLIGYNKIVSENSYPILKQENTNNYIEYRFGLGVES